MHERPLPGLSAAQRRVAARTALVPRPSRRSVGRAPSCVDLPQKSNTYSNHLMAHHKVPYLTDIQERILAHIRQTITDNGEAPTVVEIGAAVGLRSRSAVHYQLRELEAKHAVIVEPRRPRGIRLA